MDGRVEQIKVLSITEDQIGRAKELYPFQNRALNGSITKGNSNIYGAIGEIVVFDFFTKKGLNVVFESTYDYDMTIENKHIDVKTKRTTVVPKPNYLCSVSAFNTRQKCDYYFFVRVNVNMKECYLLGFKAKDEFFDQATFNKKGSKDVNDWIFKDDCYNLEILKLNKFKH
jgi:hypothetical protein